MAFPIPSHLPRRPDVQDVSSKILFKIDAATNETLNSALATSWLSELDETIHSTKVRIHERIHNDLPEFERQMAASKSVQERLRTLTTNVNSLNDSVSNAETGLVPTLITSLTKHAALAQESADARIAYQGFSHLHKFRTSLISLEDLVESGKLQEAVAVCKDVEALIQEIPSHLNETDIINVMRRKFRVAQARNEEQLSEAYTRSVILSHHELTIHPSVQVRQSDAIISLPSILASLSPDSLAKHLTTLRRDLMSQFIDYILQQPAAVITTSSGDHKHKLSLIPSPPNEESQSTRLENLTTLFTFLSAHLLSHLPPSQTSTFARSLCTPTTTSILNNLLTLFLPSSFGLLPPYLELTHQAVMFEDQIIIGLLGNHENDRPVKAWVDGVGGQYERKRRMQILDRSRNIVGSVEAFDTFFVDVDVVLNTRPAIVAVQDDEDSPMKDDAWGFNEGANGEAVTLTAPNEEGIDPVKDDAWGFDDDNINSKASAQVSPVKDDAWGLDDDANEGTDDALVAEENGWEFDDSVADETKLEFKPTQHPEVESTELLSQPGLINVNEEPDPSAAWGWNDEEDAAPSEETAWDDPWADGPQLSVPDSHINSQPPPAPSIPPSPKTSPPPLPAKVATRLEKAANKGKKYHTNGTPLTSSATSSSAPSLAASPQLPAGTSHRSQNFLSSTSPNTNLTVPTTIYNDTFSNPLSSAKRPSKLNMRAPPKEKYAVSERTKRILSLVEDVLAEGEHLASSSLLASSSPSSSSRLGSILLLTAPSVLDLYCILYPVKFVKVLAGAEQGMQFANDCAYIAGELERGKGRRSQSTVAIVGERIEDCIHCFKVLSDSWFHDVIESQQQALVNILVGGARGFTYTTEQDRYDECESAINEVLREVRRLAPQLKGILTKSKYYTAIGLVADAALSRILADILALSDIPEVESQRLGELCRILNALEGLFVEDPSQPSFVVAYVPSWLKFSYLSELLEASMADITYLFEEGALVDFAVDELVRLVRALFADTQLRTTTITKLMGGHPVQRQ